MIVCLGLNSIIIKYIEFDCQTSTIAGFTDARIEICTESDESMLTKPDINGTLFLCSADTAANFLLMSNSVAENLGVKGHRFWLLDVDATYPSISSSDRTSE